jgi:hypothetical protein
MASTLKDLLDLKGVVAAGESSRDGSSSSQQTPTTANCSRNPWGRADAVSEGRLPRPWGIRHRGW